MNFNFFFQLTFFLKLLANFIPRISFFRAKVIKIGLESWDALESCNIASPAELMNPRSLPDQKTQSDLECLGLIKPTMYMTSVSTMLLLWRQLTHKITQMVLWNTSWHKVKLTLYKQRYTHVLGWNPPLFFLKRFKVNQCWPRENHVPWENPQKIISNFFISRFQLLWAQKISFKHQGTIHPSAYIISYKRLHTWQT